jgi:glycosyltransferase involved in cell wall biosynthesis
MEKISVCIATYNGEKYIDRQLRSIIPQLRSWDEIIISDDGSHDRTQEVVSKFADKRILFIKNKGKKGPVGNFQNALTQATGEFLFLCDQDDVWLPDKVQTCLTLLKRNDLVLTNCMLVDKHLNILHQSFFSIRGSRPGICRNLYKNSYMGCCMAFKRVVLDYALPFPSNLYMHDWWIGLLVELNGKVHFCDTPQMLYVRHGENASPTGEISSLDWYQKWRNRITLINLLIRRTLLGQTL